MAYSMTFSGAPDQDGETETFFLCSIGAWGEFCEWADSLPAKFNAVKGLAEARSWKGTDRLAKQMKKAARASVPIVGVRNTLAAIVEVMGVGDPEETVSIAD